MNDSVFTSQKNKNTPTLKVSLILLGCTFLIIGLSLTISIVYAGYVAFTQPEQLSSLLDYANTEKEIFLKWIIHGNADSIEFSGIISLILIAVVASIIVRVIIAFITMCISSGKSLINLSRNFDE